MFSAFSNRPTKNFTGYLFRYEDLKGEQANFHSESPVGRSGETRHRSPARSPELPLAERRPEAALLPHRPRAGIASPALATAPPPNSPERARGTGRPPYFLVSLLKSPKAAGAEGVVVGAASCTSSGAASPPCSL